MNRCAALAMVGLCGSVASAQELMPLPPYVESFGGNVRGYYFVAPVDFVIVGLLVPNEQGNNFQSVEVVRFNNNTPPPPWSSTTNDFVSLARFVGEPAGVRLSVYILVRTGEVIGIYGQAQTQNSYGANGPFTSEIFGRSTVLNRSGMQFPLNSGPMHDIWTEGVNPVSRIEMYYVEVGSTCYPDCDPSTGVGVLDLFDFLCFQSSFVNGEAYACDCDTTTGPLVCDLFDFLCFQGAFVSGCP